MFGADNSIEPVRAVAAVAVTADGRAATRIFVEPPIREATPGDLASAARRARTSAAPEPSPVQAVAKPWGSFFRRRPAEPDKPDAVAQQHGLYTAEKRGTRHYYADYQQKQEVMRADPKRISTKLDDKQTISAMLDLAQSRGWSTVRLRGSADFQREAWVQAQVRGIAAEGNRPTATDQQEAARRKAAMAPVQAPTVPAAASKALAGTVASKDTAKVTNSLTSAAPGEKVETAPAKAAVIQQQKPTVAARRTAPGQVTAATATPAAVQASTVAANDGVVADKSKATAAERSKAVWGAVEATGKQARAADAPAAKATAGERSTSATMV
jgi:hypothetical protein